MSSNLSSPFKESFYIGLNKFDIIRERSTAFFLIGAFIYHLLSKIAAMINQRKSEDWGDITFTAESGKNIFSHRFFQVSVCLSQEVSS